MRFRHSSKWNHAQCALLSLKPPQLPDTVTPLVSEHRRTPDDVTMVFGSRAKTADELTAGALLYDHIRQAAAVHGLEWRSRSSPADCFPLLQRSDDG
jgi:hypothetical protein